MDSPTNFGPGNPPSSSDETPHILIVDDEPGNRETLGDLLRERGYRTDTVATGRQALDKAREQFFHAAILDIRLPDMNGTDLLDRLRELQPDVVTIMVTGYASLQSSVKAINSGVYAYILKPFDMGYLLQVVEQALARQRSRFEERRLLRQSQERVRDLGAREAQLLERIRGLEQELAALR